MYPDHDTLSNVPRPGYKHGGQWRDRRGGGGETLPVFFFENKHSNTNMKSQAKKQRFSSYPRRETTASGGKRCRYYKESTL